VLLEECGSTYKLANDFEKKSEIKVRGSRNRLPFLLCLAGKKSSAQTLGHFSSESAVLNFMDTANTKTSGKIRNFFAAGFCVNIVSTHHTSDIN